MAEKKEHTRGPWTAHPASSAVGALVSCGDISKGETVCIILPRRDKSETEANANLIAAATEMLGALEGAIHRLGRIEGFGCPQDILDSMRAAIRKARGEQ